MKGRIMTAVTAILPEVARIEKVRAELDDLVAQGVKVAVTAGELVALEAKGLVVDLETGKPVEPVFPLGVAYARR